MLPCATINVKHELTNFELIVKQIFILKLSNFNSVKCLPKSFRHNMQQSEDSFKCEEQNSDFFFFLQELQFIFFPAKSEINVLKQNQAL